MLEVLESFKQLGLYSVTLYYGEEIGCDDLDVQVGDRRVRLFGTPVGCLGEARVLWVGKVKDLPHFNFKTRPTKTTNPPPRDVMRTEGYWIWGTDDGVDKILEHPFHGAWE